MKTDKLYLFLVLCLLSKISYCDVIPSNSHYVNKCIKIINVDDYPGISLLGVINCLANGQSTYLIGPTTCLEKGYWHNCFTIYGVKNSYLAGKDITKINWCLDKNAFKTNIQIDPGGGYADNSNSIYSIKQYYRIVGFTDSSVVIYKCKEVDYFENGSIAVSSTGKYSGDSTKLSQTLPSGKGISANNSGTLINLYPNKVQNSFHLKLTNNYYVIVSLNIYTIEGKRVESLFVNKNETLMNYVISSDKLAKGAYYVNIVMGIAIETKKIVIV
jgi:hypothetical protein